MPAHLQAFVFNFTEKDIYESPRDVIDCLITMHKAGPDAQKNIVNVLPRASTFIRNLDEHAQIMTTDPSKFYDIIGKLG